METLLNATRHRTKSDYSGPHAKVVGHRQYDCLLQDLIELVAKDTPRDDLLRVMVERLKAISCAESIVVLELQRTEGCSNEGQFMLRGIAEAGIKPGRWARFQSITNSEVLQSGLAVKVMAEGQEVDLWDSGYFDAEFASLGPLFDVRRGGWLSALPLPAPPTGRHHPRSVLVWYLRDAEGHAPKGGDQDWRFLNLFRSCYSLATFQLRRAATSIVKSRAELQRSIGTDLLTHEVFHHLDRFPKDLERILSDAENAARMEGEANHPSAGQIRSLLDMIQKIASGLAANVERVRTATHSFMALTRSVKSKETNRIDAVDEIRHTLNFLKYRADLAKVTLCPPEARDLRIQTAPSLLMLVLVNLVRNAIEAAEVAKMTRVSISFKCWERHEPGGCFVEIDVIDDGPGLSPESEAKVFGHGATSKPKGHGLGLYNSRMIANYLGGSLTLQSPRSPTIFRLRLPADSRSVNDLVGEIEDDD